MTYVPTRAPRLHFVNMNTGKSFKIQFNPTEFEEATGANYARLTVPGLSHQVMQFTHTENRKFTMQMFFEDANFQAASHGGNPIPKVRRLIRELLHPRRAGAVETGGAPRVMMVWPGFITIQAVLTKAVFSYNRFNRMGEPCTMIVDVELEEIRDTTRLSEEVQGLKDE